MEFMYRNYLEFLELLVEDLIDLFCLEILFKVWMLV